MSSELKAARPRIRYRPGVAPPQRPTASGHTNRRTPSKRLPPEEVVDNFPDPVPIASTELDAIETYLDDFLNQLPSFIAAESNTYKE